MSRSDEVDPRLRKIDYDLNKVDFEWIKEENSLKELKKAYEALQADAGK
jgi:hypothetical protein